MLNKFYTLALLLMGITCLGQTPEILDPPAWTVPGINYVDDHTVILQLWAPNKDHVYAIGDFNGWLQDDPDHLMYQSTDGDTHWIQIDNVEPEVEYRFQYHVYPDNIRIADWYADKILDPWNDQWIPDASYPGLIEFPSAHASDPVSVFQTAQDDYNWTDAGFSRPAQNKLNIYELLVRDFTDERTYDSVIERLDYLQGLGINAIEIMPPNEFEGNESWGYNPMFYFAPDKYYGPKNEFKRFINECHQREIAVIMDMTLNHSFGLSPMVRLYFDQGSGQVTAENPWFNQLTPHDFSPGYDFNHESPHTNIFSKRVLEYWLQEYHIDGFRMDLSKGFTQNWTLGDIGAFNAYDQSRINILSDYFNHCWWVEPGSYFILEHFADNSEETVLANMGMMLWGNLSHNYGEIQMGFSGDLSWGSYQSRGWTYNNLITYAESHDEERLMFKSLNYGNSNGGYDVTDLSTSLARMEATHAFLFGIPGPKMMWQLAEIGYDESIELCGDGSYNSSCRTDNKPTHWEYLDETDRVRLYKVMRALMWLRRDHDVFSTSDFNIDVWGHAKAIRLYSPEMNVVIIGNFDVAPQSIIPGFPYAGGTWHDYFSGNSFVENNLSNAYTLQPGEYHIYTDQALPVPDIDGSTGYLTGNEGCTDPSALNYDSTAIIDDLSCQYTITLQVDLSTQTVSGSGVHVAGSFQGWSPSTTAMTDIGNGVYEYQLVATDGEQLQYKYINGNDWPQAEIVPQACGIEDGFGGYNRLYVVNSNATVPLHCFSSCAECASETVEVTFQVNMENETVSGLGVHIAGNFQGWSPGLTPMTDLGNGIWTYTAEFGIGENLEFKYINGNAWGMDESVPVECASGLNRFHMVGGSDEVLDPVCFGTCTICPGDLIPGCIDTTACNYDSAAQTDDGSCDYACYGCTNPMACNYDSTATLDDGSCDFSTCIGCTDSQACNFDSGALIDDGSCNYDCLGCLDSTACNYNSEATLDDGSCEYITCTGCTDPGACNYDSSALIDDDTCDYDCLVGCTYELASNYNPLAIEDDGSCVFGDSLCGDNTYWDENLGQCIGVASCPGDLDGNSVINTADLLQFLAQFGQTCP